MLISTEQRTLAENPNHVKTKYHYEIDEYGVKQRVAVALPIKPWWYIDGKGEYVITIRYGSRLLELAQGKSAIVVGSEDNLVPTINMLIEAIAGGELDAVIDAVQTFGHAPKKKAA